MGIKTQQRVAVTVSVFSTYLSYFSIPKKQNVVTFFLWKKQADFFSVVHKTSLQRAQDMRIEDIFRMSRILPTKTRLDVLHVHMFIKKVFTTNGLFFWKVLLLVLLQFGFVWKAHFGFIGGIVPGIVHTKLWRLSLMCPQRTLHYSDLKIALNLSLVLPVLS